MRHPLRDLKSGWLTGGLHVLIVFAAAQTESSQAWPFALAAMAVVSFFAWMANYRRYRQVHDLPTSKVASAAQGYVELFGRSAQIQNMPVLSPLTGLPCCWYRYCVERKTGNDKWQHEDSGESVAHFLLVDDTGECVISPDGAEVLFARESTWTRGDRRYTEWLLLPQGILYALGEFTTSGNVTTAVDRNRQISELLGDWKKDMPELVRRFDANRDGKVDLKEWEEARLEARREVERNQAASLACEGVHLLAQPRDGRVFILAAALPEKIGSRFLMWSWLHLAVLFMAGAGSYVMFTGMR